MIICSKCQKEVSSLKGEYAAYALWALTPFAVYWLGPFSALFFAGLGFYLYKIYNSKTCICTDCQTTGCPSCHRELSANAYCTKCKTLVCPLCGEQQPHDKGTTWLKASVLFPVGLVVAIGLFLLDPWFLPLAYMLYVLFSAPKCGSCGAKVYLSVI